MEQKKIINRIAGLEAAEAWKPFLKFYMRLIKGKKIPSPSGKGE